MHPFLHLSTWSQHQASAQRIPQLSRRKTSSVCLETLWHSGCQSPETNKRKEPLRPGSLFLTLSKILESAEWEGRKPPSPPRDRLLFPHTSCFLQWCLFRFRVIGSLPLPWFVPAGTLPSPFCWAPVPPCNKNDDDGDEDAAKCDGHCHVGHPHNGHYLLTWLHTGLLHNDFPTTPPKLAMIMTGPLSRWGNQVSELSSTSKMAQTSNNNI